MDVSLLCSHVQGVINFLVVVSSIFYFLPYLGKMNPF